MKNVNSALAKYLKELRGTRSLYQVEQDIGFSRSLLRRYEIGERTPEEGTLKKLAAYYQVDYCELKFKQFEDLYPLGSENREMIKIWLAQQKA